MSWLNKINKVVATDINDIAKEYYLENHIPYYPLISPNK